MEDAKDIWARLAAAPVNPPYVTDGGTPRRWKLTNAQKELAQLMWRQELKIKQKNQKKIDTSRAVSVVTQADDE